MAKRKKKKGGWVGTAVLIAIALIGLSLLLYPTVAEHYNRRFSLEGVSEYVEAVEQLEEEDYSKELNAALAYNQKLKERIDPYSLTDELKTEYESVLNVAGNGVMGYIEIGKLNLVLPVFHGTEENVLHVAIGHLDWTYLPVGGEGTHCVLSGHRGLPNAKLFTDIDSLREGDLFTMTILKETVTYEVDQIRTVLPDEVSNLLPEKDKDHCTLVTCTPYGINTHRLLVRGHRVENVVAGANVVSEAVVIDPLLVAPVVAVPLILVLVSIVMFKKPQSKKKKVMDAEPVSHKG